MNRSRQRHSSKSPLISQEIGEEKAAMGLTYGARLVMVSEMAERMAFYGVVVVLMPYLMDEVGMSQPGANAVVNAFSFWAYAACLAGGYVSDARLGKLMTIMYASLLYVIGLTVLTASAMSPKGSSLRYMLFPSLFLIGCSTGGIKANVLPLFASQLPPEHLDSSSFRWFYWSINLGALIGQLVTPLLHAPNNNTAYYYSFGLPAVCACLSLLLIYSGRSRLTDRPPTGSLLHECYKTVVHAIRERWASSRAGSEQLSQDLLSYAITSAEHHETARDLRQTIRACYVFLFFPVYWFAYSQTHTNYVPQARNLARPDWMPPEWLNMLNALTLTVMIPVCEGTLFPLLTRHNKMPTNLMRIIIGYVIQATAIGCAMLLQTAIDNRGFYNSKGEYYLPAGREKVSVWWQVPQFTLGALSEIFASASGLEYAFSEAPVRMKAIVMSLYLMTSAGGSLLGMGFSPFMRPDRMRVVYSYLCLAMFGTAAAFLYVFQYRIAVEAETAAYQETQREREVELQTLTTTDGDDSEQLVSAHVPYLGDSHEDAVAVSVSLAT